MSDRPAREWNVEDLIERVLGPYPPLRLTLFEPLEVKEGGTSLVYICKVRDSDEMVAVKRLREEFAYRPGVAAAFLRECHAWLTMEPHTNIVAAYSAHRSPREAPIVVLEYYDRSLRDAINDDVVDPVQATCWGLDIVRGLQHAATCLEGFIHGDVKPENILIGKQSEAAVTDLGLALGVNIAINTPTDVEESEGTSSRLNGTPMYMAPEQALGGARSSAGDVYSLGCVMYEMICGEPVFGAPTGTADYLLRHLHHKPVPLADRCDRVSDALSETVMACLSKDPRLRPSMDALGSALSSVPEGVGACPTDTVSGTPTPSRLNRIGKGLVNLGAYQQAERVIDRVLTLPLGAGARAQALLTLSQIKGGLEKWDDATHVLDDLEPLLERGGNWRGAYLTERAKIASAKGAPDEALELAKEATRYGGSVGWMNLAWALSEVGDLPRAIEAAERAVGIATNLGYYYSLVGWLIQERRAAEAVAWAQDVVQSHPHSGEAYALRAGAAYALIAEDPWANHFLVDVILYDLEVADALSGPTDHTRRTRAGLPVAMMFRADQLLKEGQRQDAERYWTRVAAMDDPQHSQTATLNLALSHEESGDDSGAAEAFGLAAKGGDRHIAAMACMNLAILRVRQDDHDRAIEAYRLAIDLDDREWSSRARVNLGALLRDLGRKSEAVAILEEARRTCPPEHSAVAAMNLGLIYERDGDSKTAIDMYSAALNFRDVGHHNFALEGLVRLGVLPK